MDLSQHRPITDEEAEEMLSGIDQAERAGMFDNLFCREQVVKEVPASREKLIQSISPNMKLTKGFFLRIYGYELSFPGFKEKAISELEESGCTMARAYYDDVIGEYQEDRGKIMKPIADTYIKECNRKWEQRQKRGEEQRKKRKIQLLTRKKQLLNSLKSIEN